MGLGGGFGVAAAVWAYVREALAAAAAACAMLRAEEANFRALALTFKMVAWISSSCQLNQVSVWGDA